MNDMNDVSPDIAVALMKMSALKRQYDQMKKESTEVWNEYNDYRYNKIPELAEDLGITGGTFPGIGRLTIRDELTAKQTDKVKLYGWMCDNGHEDMLQSTINSSTLRAFVREQIKQSNPVPDGVEINAYPIAVLTKL